MDLANVDYEFSHDAKETMGNNNGINISVNRASAIADAAMLFVDSDGASKYVPNANFSDAECSLFALMTYVYRQGMSKHS